MQFGSRMLCLRNRNSHTLSDQCAICHNAAQQGAWQHALRWMAQEDIPLLPRPWRADFHSAFCGIKPKVIV